MLSFCAPDSTASPLLPFISREPDALYRRFVAAMQAGGLRTFYASIRSWRVSRILLIWRLRRQPSSCAG